MTRWSSRSTTIRRPFVHHFRGRDFEQHCPGDRDSFLFTAPDGGPIRLGNWRKRVFYPAARAAGIEPLPRVHDMRHTAAHLAIDTGANASIVKEMLGHASIRTTFDIYGGAFETSQAEMARRLDAVYQSAAAQEGALR